MRGSGDVPVMVEFVFDGFTHFLSSPLALLHPFPITVNGGSVTETVT